MNLPMRLLSSILSELGSDLSGAGRRAGSGKSERPPPGSIFSSSDIAVKRRTCARATVVGKKSERRILIGIALASRGGGSQGKKACIMSRCVSGLFGLYSDQCSGILRRVIAGVGGASGRRRGRRAAARRPVRGRPVRGRPLPTPCNPAPLQGVGMGVGVDPPTADPAC